MAKSRKAGVSKFLEDIAPGGKYSKYSISVLIAIGVVMAVLATLNFIPTDQLKKIFGLPVPTPSAAKPVKTVCPNYAIPKGAHTYLTSYGPGVTGPKRQTTTFDPLDPAVGQNQTVTVVLKNDSPVTDATATFFSDTTSQIAKFKLISGTTSEGTWQLTWKIKDSYNCQYLIKFNFVSSTGTYNGEMRIR